MGAREQIDFHLVEPHQIAIHKRLENWAHWCHGSGGSSCSPMFRLYRSGEHWERTLPSIPVDGIDAQLIAKEVAKLPAPHAAALNWNYIERTSPRRQCQKLGCSMAGLQLYVRDGRQMLVNRLDKKTGQKPLAG